MKKEDILNLLDPGKYKGECVYCGRLLNHTHYLCPSCWAVNDDLYKKTQEKILGELENGNIDFDDYAECNEAILGCVSYHAIVLGQSLKDQVKAHKNGILIIAVILGLFIIVLFSAVR